MNCTICGAAATHGLVLSTCSAAYCEVCVTDLIGLRDRVWPIKQHQLVVLGASPEMDALVLSGSGSDAPTFEGCPCGSYDASGSGSYCQH